METLRIVKQIDIIINYEFIIYKEMGTGIIENPY